MKKNNLLWYNYQLWLRGLWSELDARENETPAFRAEPTVRSGPMDEREAGLNLQQSRPCLWETAVLSPMPQTKRSLYHSYTRDARTITRQRTPLAKLILFLYTSSKNKIYIYIFCSSYIFCSNYIFVATIFL